MEQKIKIWDIKNETLSLEDRVLDLISQGNTIVTITATNTAEGFNKITDTRSQSTYFTTKALIVYKENK